MSRSSSSREEACALHRRVLRLDVAERPVREIGGEDDVHDMLAREHRGRCDRVDDRDRPFELHVGFDPELLAQLPAQRLDQRLPHVDTAARQQPVLLARLLLAAEQHAPLPEQDRRDTDPRLHQCFEEPKPRSPRSLAGSSSTSTSSSRGTGRTTSWAIRIPGSTTNVSREVGVQQRNLQLAAVAGVDEARCVHDRDAVLARQGRSAAGRSPHSRRGSRPRGRSGRARARPARARRGHRLRGRAPRRPRRPGPGRRPPAAAA